MSCGGSLRWFKVDAALLLKLPKSNDQLREGEVELSGAKNGVGSSVRFVKGFQNLLISPNSVGSQLQMIKQLLLI